MASNWDQQPTSSTSSDPHFFSDKKNTHVGDVFSGPGGIKANNVENLNNYTTINQVAVPEIIPSIEPLKSVQEKFEEEPYIIDDLSQSSHEQIQNIFPRMMEVSYVDHKAVTRKEKYFPSHQSTGFQNASQKTTETNESNFSDILSKLLLCKILFLVGLPGAGKSTLCRRASKHFSKSSQFVCILVKFMNLNFNPRERKLTLRQLLIDYNYPELREDECKSAFQWIIANENNLLLILDGYDQANWYIQENSPQINYNEPQPVWDLITNLCSKVYLPKCHILFTSRPHSTKTLPRRFRRNLTIELLDLSIDSMKMLFYIFSGSKANDFWSTLHANAPQLVSLCGNPLFLQLVVKACLSPNSNFANITTLTRLFSFVFDNLNMTVHAGSIKIETVIQGLKKLAFNATSSNTVVMDENNVKEVGLNVDTVRHLVISQESSKYCYLFEGKKPLFFIHQTLQQYLTALYIHQNMNKLKFWWFVKTKLFTPHWSVVRRFLFGIIFDVHKNAEGQDWKMKQMKIKLSLKMDHVRRSEGIRFIINGEYNLVEKCVDVRECADEEITEEAARQFPTKAWFGGIQLSNSDAHAVSLVLRKIKTKIQYFDLSYCDLNSQTFRYFVRAIKVMEGSIDCLDIGVNQLTSDDVDEICDILSKINVGLVMWYCFDDGTWRGRPASEEEKAKIRAKLNSLGHSNLKIEF